MCVCVLNKQTNERTMRRSEEWMLAAIGFNLLAYMFLTNSKFFLGGRGSVVGRNGGKAASGGEPSVTLSAREEARLSGRINACIFILARNSDLDALLFTIDQFEAQFNNRFHYPYVIVNNEPFLFEFEDAVLNRTESKVEFGTLPPRHWWLPRAVKKKKFFTLLNTTLARVPNGNMISYHLMCRYFSGFFFRHKLTLKYDYYLRLDTHVDFPCPIREDPFAELVRRNKSYGFTIALNEDMGTIPTLWRTIKKWIRKTNRTLRNDHVPELVELMALQNESVPRQSCGFEQFHFWNNFELASFALWRDPQYLEFFDFLEESGGFFYERWGDAPVHTFYIMAMIELDKVHRFNNLGYGHFGTYNIPEDADIRRQCRANVRDMKPYDCNFKWDNLTSQLPPSSSSSSSNSSNTLDSVNNA